jgi:hypothetical protein
MGMAKINSLYMILFHNFLLSSIFPLEQMFLPILTNWRVIGFPTAVRVLPMK